MIGLHFFNPVSRMKLWKLLLRGNTSDERTPVDSERCGYVRDTGLTCVEMRPRFVGCLPRNNNFHQFHPAHWIKKCSRHVLGRNRLHRRVRYGKR